MKAKPTRRKVYSLFFRERGQWIKSLGYFFSTTGARNHAGIIGARKIRIRLR